LLLNGRQIPQRGGYSIPESTRIKVIDFGGATYDNDKKKSSIVNTRQYRAPEVILGVGDWSMPSDLWSIGCILAELLQGELLFATHDNIEHLALIERVIGPFPSKMLKKAKNVELVHEAFDYNDNYNDYHYNDYNYNYNSKNNNNYSRHRMERVLPADQLSYVKRTAPLEKSIHITTTTSTYNDNNNNNIINSNDNNEHEHEDNNSVSWFLRLMRRILVIEPDKRANGRESLRKF